LSLRETQPMTPDSARMLNPLQLAYIGDTIWDLLIRSRLIFNRYNVRHMHKAAVGGVNAQAQAKALARMEGALTPDEEDIVRRGRNSHARHPCPRNQDPADYKAATGLEALVGYLYLTGQDERLLELFDITQREEEPCPDLK